MLWTTRPSGENAHGTELLAPQAPQLVLGNVVQLVQLVRHGSLEQPRRLVVILVRAPLRLRDDPVDDAQFEAVGSVGLEGSGRLPRLASIAPEDGGAAFGRDDRVDCVFL